MNLKSMQQRKPAQPGTLVNLDDAEMALALIDIQKTTTVTYAAPQQSPEWLSELQSAASLIMDKEEIEALAHEIELLRTPHRVAA